MIDLAAPRAKRSVQRTALALVLLLGAGIVNACSGAESSHLPRTAGTARHKVTAPRIPVRGCETSAYGALGSTPVNRAGPIGFADSWARDQPMGEHRGSRIRPTKVLIVVDAGATVTVTVPYSAQNRLRLLYASLTLDSRDGFYNFGAADRATTFVPCRRGEGPFGDHPRTQFPGYFLVRAPGCYRVGITEHGSTHRMHADLTLGRAC